MPTLDPALHVPSMGVMPTNRLHPLSPRQAPRPHHLLCSLCPSRAPCQPLILHCMCPQWALCPPSTFTLRALDGRNAHPASASSVHSTLCPTQLMHSLGPQRATRTHQLLHSLGPKRMLCPYAHRLLHCLGSRRAICQPQIL